MPPGRPGFDVGSYRRTFSPDVQTEADTALAAKLGRVLMASPDLFDLASRAVAIGEAMAPVPAWAVQGRAILSAIG